MTEKLHIAVCSPTREMTYPEYHNQIAGIVKAAAVDDVEVTVFRVACSMLPQARSYLAQRALNDGADILLWVDDDMIFDPADAYGLCMAATAYSVVGAAASMRRNMAGINVNYLHDMSGQRVTYFDKHELLQVRSIGFGLIATGREVYEAMAQDLPPVKGIEGLLIRPYFQCIIEDGTWFSEDVSFCKRLEKLDCNIYLDPAVRLGHRGSYDYYLEDSIGAVPRMNPLHMDYK